MKQEGENSRIDIEQFVNSSGRIQSSLVRVLNSI